MIVETEFPAAVNLRWTSWSAWRHSTDRTRKERRRRCMVGKYELAYLTQVVFAEGSAFTAGTYYGLMFSSARGCRYKRTIKEALRPLLRVAS